MTADLRALLGHTHFASATDAELVRRYVADRDDLAFAELVHRHAPAVYAACRRFVSRSADLDDAFQAVFVLLSQKAGTLNQPDSLAGWLCGAAGRIARKVRDRSARTAGTPLDTIPEPAAAETESTDLKAVLDEELALLPPAYREAVLLCDVEGVSRRVAAKRLGIPESTLSNRLTRARGMLGTRLLRRGVALGAGLSLTSVSIASVPAKLVSLTVSRITTGTVPAELFTLATGGVPVMSVARGTSLLLAVALVIGVGAVGLVAKAPVKPPPAAKLPDPPPDPITSVRTGVGGMQMAPNGRLLAVGGKEDGDASGPGVTLMDPIAGGVVRKLMVPKDREGGFRSYRFTPDGKHLLASAGRGGAVYRWEVDTGNLTDTFDTFDDAPICWLAVSPDGRRVATTHNDLLVGKPTKESLRVRDAVTGKELLCHEPPDGWHVNEVAFAPIGCGILVGYKGKDGGGSYLAELCGGCGTEVLRITPTAVSVGGTPCPGTIAVTADGKHLIVGGGDLVPQPGGGGKCAGNLRVYDRKSGEPLKTLDQDRGGWIDFALSADGKRLFAWTHTGEERWRVRDGRKFGSGVGEVACYNTATWKRLWAVERDYAGDLHAAPTPDGKRALVADGDGLWHLDAATGEQLPGQYARFKK
jgi:RNA polymerase sigma factor (sigma-70 family)